MEVKIVPYYRAIEKIMFGTSKCAHAGVFFVGGSTAVSVWPNKINYYILCVGGGGDDVTCGHKDRVLPIWCRFFPYSNNMENDSVLSTT